MAKFGPFEFNVDSGELTKHGISISLQKQSRLALKLLVEQPGTLVSREKFKETLWKDVNVDFENGLNTTIARLRQTLGTEYGRRIKAEPKLGYWFDTTVAFEIAAKDLPATGAIPSIPSDLIPELALQPPAKRRRSWGPLGLACLLAVCLVFWVAAGIYRVRGYLPTVVRIDQLTNDGQMKSPYIAADEKRIYLNEMADRKLQLFQVLPAGGTPHAAATSFGGSWPDPQDTNVSTEEVLVRLESGLVVWSPVSNTFRRISELSCDFARWSPDYRRVACSVGGSLYTMNADGSQQRLVRRMAAIEAVAWTADGRRIRVSGRDRLGQPLTLRDIDPVEGNQQRRVVPEENETIAGLFLHNVWFWVSSRDNNIYAQSRAGQVKALTQGPIKFYSLSPNVADNSLYTVGQRERGELMRYDGTRQEWLPYLIGVSADCLTWTADGKYVAYVTYPDRELWRSRADGSNSLQLTSAPTQVYHPTWSPDGTQLAFEARTRGGVWRLMVVSRDGGPPQELAPKAEPTLQEREPVWSPDGRMIAFAPMEDATPPEQIGLYLLDLRSGRIRRLPGTNGLFSPRWVPDQTGLLALTRQHEIVFYRLDAGSVKTITDGHKAWPYWAGVGEEVCFLDGVRQSIGCAKLNGGTIREVAQVPFVMTGNTFSGTWDYNYWAGFMPDGTPVLLKNVGLSEIYALRLNWR